MKRANQNTSGSGRSRRRAGSDLSLAFVDDSLPTPLYHQIYVLLREKIVSGAYTDGQRVPSEHELEKTFGVSRITAKRALDELASEGLVIRQRGTGTVVTFSPPASALTGETVGLIENLLAMALETDVEILSFDYVPAPPKVAEALEMETGATVQETIRTRKKDGQAFSYSLTHIPEDIGRLYEKDDIANHPMLTLLERTGHSIKRARQMITATLADNMIGPALGVRVGSPLLKVTRVVYDADDRPVEFIVVHYRPDLYQLNLNLSRVKGDTANKWSADG